MIHESPDKHFTEQLCDVTLLYILFRVYHLVINHFYLPNVELCSSNKRSGRL